VVVGCGRNMAGGSAAARRGGGGRLGRVGGRGDGPTMARSQAPDRVAVRLWAAEAPPKPREKVVGKQQEGLGRAGKGSRWKVGGWHGGEVAVGRGTVEEVGGGGEGGARGGEQKVEDDPPRRREDRAAVMGWWGPHAESYVGGFSC
jgi:hypothetical protein